jgi:haloalkane dehalogenase
VISRLLKDEVRVIAPDLVGLGLSGKPRGIKAHSLDFHAEQIGSLVGALDLKDITIVGQDWGGPILGLMAARNRERISGALFANTGLRAPGRPPRGSTFHRFSHLPIVSTLAFRFFGFPLGILHKVQGDPASIGQAERRAYRFPLPSFAERAAPLALARMVPLALDHPTMDGLREAEEWARSFSGPVSLVWGTRDPILGGLLPKMRELFPEADVVETQAGHFLQEEVPEILTESILRVVSTVKDNALIPSP